MAVAWHDYPMQVRDDVTQNCDVDVVWFQRPHDRSFRQVKISTERLPLIGGKLVGSYRVPKVENKQAVAAICLIAR